jgi:UDP-N-acetylmuramoyl-L-alanyl-D-glutamate--2,6-diaminopimelate ligase
LELHGLLNEMRESGVEKAVMEVSSHALEQFRIEGLNFRTAVFTNLSQDHLDYHRSMKRYSSAKQRLFMQVDSEKGWNIINGDDQHSEKMVRQNHRPVLRYSVQKGNADIYPVSAEFTRFCIDAKLITPAGEAGVNSKLIGRHNLYNIMAAVGVGVSFGLSIDQIEHGINSFELVPGRLEQVNEGQGFPVLVDYAHTPDAMEKVLTAVKPLVNGKLITVFGCGGDRDRGKRPLMGKIAEKVSDISILTSDNPRTEDPERIIDDVLTGVKEPGKMHVFIDRTAAIKWAVNSAKDEDCVLILGKGHETYQVLGRNRIDYDDREIARNFIKQASCY